jgi:transcriptional repressor NrdR
MVVKRDKSREIFNEDKLMKGLIKACEKRPIRMSVLEQMVDDIKNQLQNSMEKEVSSLEIGNMVMEKLKKIDSVAYIRFASVYRQFSDTNEFINELLKIANDNSKEI